MTGPTVEVADLRDLHPDGGPERPGDIDLEEVRGAATATLTAEGRADAHLSVTVVDDARMAELHLQYLNVEGPTDVLSFPLDDGIPGPVPLLGEVVVCADTAAREAKQRGLTARYELLLYAVHGTLHLLGYDDHEDAQRRRMHARQKEIVDRFLEGRA